MLENQNISTKNIIDCLQAGYGIKITSLKYLAIGADINAAVYKAQTDDNKSYFIKLKQNYDNTLSLAITNLLYESGLQHIISPIKTIKGKETQSIDGYTIVVYPFIEGEDGFNRILTDDQWFMLGKALRKIHEVEIPSVLLNNIPRETYSNKWRELLKSLLITPENKFNRDEAALKLIESINKNKVVIQRLLDRAFELGQKARRQTTKFVLCHSDIHGGNVLIDEKNDIYIVDWDEPILAPKERDLMFIGGGVANVWNKPDEEKSFYRGYGVTEVNKMIIAYYRHERIVTDIVEFCRELLFAPIGNADKQVMLKHFTDMFEPQGVVDIAFKTYETLSN